jgi:hypothetical protein
MALPNCRKIVITYNVFQNGCPIASQRSKNLLKIRVQQQRERCPAAAVSYVPHAAAE